MTVFGDTSGIFVVLDPDDRYHGEADHLWRQLVLETEQLVCTDYVLIESFALVQRRLECTLPDYLRKTSCLWSGFTGLKSPTTGPLWPLS